MTTRTLELLDRLVGFPTVSRDSNRALIDFVADLLGRRGIDCEIVGTPDGSKANLFATIGPAEVPGMLLSGHTDVVPVDGQDWASDPFRLAVREGRAFGRGTADMKGFLAAALALAERAAGERLAMPLHLAFSHDEEVGCVGVRSLIGHLARRAFEPRFCLVGEPTSMRVATGHKGKIAARACAHGLAGHSALAPKALNAIHLAADFVASLREAQARLAASGRRDADYDVPYTTIHVGRIEGGTVLNIVPERCALDFEIRNVSGDDPLAILHALRAEAEAIAARERPRFACAAIDVEVTNAYPALDTPPDADVVAFVRSLTEEDATCKVAFGTEGGLFDEAFGVPTVVCGPGSMDQGHKPDEFVSLEQLAAADRMMDRLLAAIRA
ncbi:acetylornithine deacetylase [Antarcticirhabdus aurantiaca]|uniref:Acetylornithine deacetylase n=1 Tax=Antarcticirhabdus aurantiaca TaxID=2606717 RepID=A0ACD4NP07_9HYPH|nr:acetylornithine deacetylase [Antarcticirhabdus aurantiaca]WAJ28355.1 acetylornithine deacetylase [Jeongeuplla avenae]